MSIRIEAINVEKLGPISELNLRLGQFNLIYGRNELGKTYLVEFILKSLFRNLGNWRLRDFSANGCVLVSGIEDQPVSFSLSSRRKLEDYWETADQGLPINIARLLVVKGGELSMVENTPGGVDKAVLKEYLSSEYVLDKIQNKIPATIQRSEIYNTIIEGSNRGDNKRRNSLIKDLRKTNNLFDRIDELYSGGPMESLNRENQNLKRDVDNQLKAKRHLAYTLEQEKNKLQEKRAKVPERELEELRQKFYTYQQKTFEFKRKERRFKEAQQNSAHYNWLKYAIEAYEKRSQQGGIRPKPLYLILGLLSLVAAIVSAYLNALWVTALTTIFLIVFGWLYTTQYRGLITRAVDIDTVDKISSDFKRRFGRKLTNIALMRELMLQIETDYFVSKSLKDELEEYTAELDTLEININQQLNRLGCKNVEKENWESSINGLANKVEYLEGQIRQNERDLASLNIDEADYLVDCINIEYDELKLTDLKNQRDAIQQKFQELTHDLDNLKQAICSETNNDITNDWEDLIQDLKIRYEEVISEYKEITSKILAQILVNQEINKIREKEDEKIRDGLHSKFVSDPLFGITKRYQRVELEGDKIFIGDPYSDFPLSELSTAAQEQVLLALRIGLASKIIKQERMFLILDDAFQHSDWERREWLLDNVVGLAQNGWQIIYFTMDDHIKDLFLDKGKTVFGGQFHAVGLDGVSLL